jgi:hypothetical protein
LPDSTKVLAALGRTPEEDDTSACSLLESSAFVPWRKTTYVGKDEHHLNGEDEFRYLLGISYFNECIEIFPAHTF